MQAIKMCRLLICASGTGDVEPISPPCTCMPACCIFAAVAFCAHADSHQPRLQEARFHQLPSGAWSGANDRDIIRHSLQ